MQYLLGGSKEQLAVWHGQQMTSPFCDTAWRRNVFLYPTEYLTNGIGWNGVHEDLTPIITKPDGSKEYRISGHVAYRKTDEITMTQIKLIFAIFGDSLDPEALSKIARISAT
ncbi:MAG: hypothetical protein IPM61_01070 [Chlorobi bacterium]|nr:hypothetical protein [Chlorobiota bacterium]MBX7215652.1 hypothetical protein [Candidatus Kapabacteria bacterium]